MNIAFAGLRHGHIFTLARMAHENPHFTVTGYWEEDAAAREAAAPHFTEPAYPTYDALLADPSVDVVAVGDYYGIRGERILRALRAGKHVICDKPVCTRLDELVQIEALLREKNLKLGCMLDLRYDPALRLARTIVREGQLGEIHAVNFTGQHPLNWPARAHWYFEEGKHGGTFNDIAIHGIDAVTMVTDLSYEKTLCARQWNAYAHAVPHFLDCAQLMGMLENGAGLTADVSYAAPTPAAFSLPSYWRFTFWGEAGFLECRLGEGKVTLARSGDVAPRNLPAPPVAEDVLSDFYREILGEAVAFPTQSVLTSTRTLLRIQQAADSACVSPSAL